MHVLFLPSWYPASEEDLSGSFFREQAIALANAGAKVGVVAPSLRSLRQPIEALFGDNSVSVENDRGVETYRAAIPHLTPRFPQLTARRISRLCNRVFRKYARDHGTPHVLHVHAAMPVGSAAVNLSSEYRIPLVYSEHSSAFARNRVSQYGLQQAREVSLQAVRSYCVSKPFSKFLERTLNFPEETIGVMPNSVHPGFLSHKVSAPISGLLRLLHVSLLDEKKNVSTLLAAFAIVFKGQPEVTLEIGGEGPTRVALEAQAHRLGIQDQVRFLGRLRRTAVVDALARADVFILPSRFETFGVVVIEALAMGVPVIATRCGGPEDIVADLDGTLVPVDDTDALAAALTRFASPSPLEDRLARRERCRERFGSKKVAKRWLKIYADVLSEHRS